MKTEIKQRLLNYLENGGSEEERQSLIRASVAHQKNELRIGLCGY